MRGGRYDNAATGADPALPRQNERRQVSIMFADMCASTEAMATMDPLEAEAFIDRHVDIMVEATRYFGGTVFDMIGDGIMSIFGASGDTDDHALRACLAGLRIISGVRAMRSVDPLNCPVRVGVNSGPVLLRTRATDYGDLPRALGPSVNMASKAEAIAGHNEILVTDSVIEQIRWPHEAVKVGALAYGANAEPRAVYRLDRVSIEAALAEQFSLRPRNKLIGRDNELGRMSAYLEAVGKSRGGVLTLCGDRGIGKSRLCLEFERMAQKAGLGVVELLGNALQKATPFGVVAALIKRFQSEPGQGGIEGLSSRDRHWLGSLAGASTERDAKAEIDSTAVRAAFIRLIEARAAVAPQLVLVDDYQHLDAETKSMIRLLSRRVRRAPIIICVAGWLNAAADMSELNPEILHLYPLSTNARQALFRQAAERQALDLSADDILHLAERVGGNPFMLEEVARSYDVTRRESDAIPNTVEAILQSRMDALPPNARDLLALASVGGGTVSRRILRVASRLPASQFEALLERLRTSEFLTSERGDKLAFIHTLAQEACYRGLLDGDRTTLHENWLQAIKAELPEADWPLEDLARHARRAQLLDEALGFLRRACYRALSVSAVQSALALYDEAMDICAQIGPAADKKKLEFSLAVQQPLMIRRDTRDVLSLMTELRAVAVRLGDPVAMNKVDSALANMNWYFGRYRTAKMIGLRTVANTEDSAKEFSTHSFSRLGLANPLYAIGQVDAAVRALEDLTRDLAGKLQFEKFGGMTTLSLWAKAWLYWFRGDLGVFNASPDALQDSFEMSDMQREPYTRAALRATAGYAYLQTGRDKSEAVSMLEHAYAIICEKELWTIEPNAAGWLAVAAARNGQPEIGEAAIEATSARAVSRYAAVHTEFCMKQGLAECQLARGHADHALAAIKDAMKPMIRSRALSYLSYGLETQGRIHLARGAYDDARCSFERADRLARHCGFAPLVARLQDILPELRDS